MDFTLQSSFLINFAPRKGRLFFFTSSLVNRMLPVCSHVVVRFLFACVYNAIIHVLHTSLQSSRAVTMNYHMSAMTSSGQDVIVVSTDEASSQDWRKTMKVNKTLGYKKGIV